MSELQRNLEEWEIGFGDTHERWEWNLGELAWLGELNDKLALSNSTPAVAGSASPYCQSHSYLVPAHVRPAPQPSASASPSGNDGSGDGSGSNLHSNHEQKVRLKVFTPSSMRGCRGGRQRTSSSECSPHDGPWGPWGARQEDRFTDVELEVLFQMKRAREEYACENVVDIYEVQQITFKFKFNKSNSNSTNYIQIQIQMCRYTMLPFAHLGIFDPHPLNIFCYIGRGEQR